MKDVSITMIQADLFWENKAKNLAMLSQKIEAITECKQIVLLPEMFSTGFSMQPEKWAEPMDGTSIQWMQKTAQKNKIILGGSLIIEEQGKYYNRFIWIQPDGKCMHYNKRHLFAYAGEDQHYTPGTERIIVQVNGWRFLLQVCYDLRFPVWARQQPSNTDFEYDAIVYVANWPEKRSAAWNALLTARAIENQSFVIGVNRYGNDGNNFYHSGDSQIVSPLGEILTKISNEEKTETLILKAEDLKKVRDRFPFYEDADAFHILH